MTSSYESVGNAVDCSITSLDITSPSGTSPGSTQTFLAPESETRTYEPRVSDEWREGAPIPDFHSRRKAGEILMSPYSVGTRSKEYYVVERPYVTKHAAQNYRNGFGCSGVSQVFGYRTWTERDHSGSLSTSMPSYSGDLESIPDLVSRLGKSTQLRAWAESFNGLDLLTELAEADKTAKLGIDLVKGAAGTLNRVGKSIPIHGKKWKNRGYKSLLRSADKGLRLAGRSWLTAIYGIMPVVYAIGDVRKLFREKHHTFKTYRAFEDADISGSPLRIGAPEVYRYSDRQGTIKVTSTVKVKYTLGALQSMADRIHMNLLRTAWERIPFSFVCDWLVNVGDAITSATSIDYSSGRKGCTSVRQEYIEREYLVDTSSDVSEIHLRTHVSPHACESAVKYDETYRHKREVESLLSQMAVDSYDRTLFDSPPKLPVFNPHITWKRMITALALAYRPTRKLLTRLRI